MDDRHHGVFMELIIGGSFQGKLEYARQKLQRRGCYNIIILDGGDIDAAGAAAGRFGQASGPLILNRLHLFVRNCIQKGYREEEAVYPVLDNLLRENPETVIVCDEVGYGVVPLSEEERKYREAAGRTLCYLAQRADSMERVIGGMPMKIK